ncbi:putative nuclease HARBI1 [Anastrepha ludens]|uniref:putative nuclease HARBI1 n=1 Tax=Anastrepha ludens TaxID=28586 RepID=UPI0023AEAD09|nr:putative nuclease HARBI1 [Anastrepha ludens]
MDSIAFCLDFNESTNNDARRTRKKVRDNAVDVFQLPDDVFVKQFRLNKIAFQYVLNILKREMLPVIKTWSISPELKLEACLRFFAEGGYQNGTGQDFNIGMAQSTVSIVLSEVLNILEATLCPRWISLAMTETEELEAKRYFFGKTRIPGIVMCADGTHIKILKPAGDNSHLYYNRKGYYSINAMIICDHKQRIRYVNSRYAGASHDSFIWENSEASRHFQTMYENGRRSTRLLGVSGYPLLPWLITPFRNAGANTPQSRFNKSHSSGRNIVERTIGVWKNWCRCLLSARQLHYSPEKVAQIVNVAPALHNIRIHYNISDEYLEGVFESEEYENGEPVQHQRYTNEANQIRNEMLHSFL